MSNGKRSCAQCARGVDRLNSGSSVSLISQNLGLLKRVLMQDLSKVCITRLLDCRPRKSQSVTNAKSLKIGLMQTFPIPKVKLQGQRAGKGVFIPTSAFTKEAREYAFLIKSKTVPNDIDRWRASFKAYD